MEISSEQIRERFDELPVDVQDAVESAQVEETVRAVATGHGLHVDQLGELMDETLYVMLGFASPAVFPTAIANTTHIDMQTASAIAGEISNKLFIPIRESMRSFMEERLAKSVEPSDVSPPAATPAYQPGEAPKEPDVIMPSAAKAISAPPQAIQAPVVPIPKEGITILPTSIPPVVKPSYAPADVALSNPVLTVAKKINIDPASVDVENTPATRRYAVDPYREPVQ